MSRNEPQSILPVPSAGAISREDSVGSDYGGVTSDDGRARGGAQLYECGSEYTAVSSMQNTTAPGDANGVGWSKALNWKNLFKKPGGGRASNASFGADASLKDLYGFVDDGEAFGAVIKHGVTDTVFYFLKACRNHPSIPLITAVTFSLLVFGSLYAIILLGQQTASEKRTETEALANELAQAFSSQLENSLLYAYSLSSYALNVQEYQSLSVLAHGWPKIFSATGTPKRQLPPEYLGANTSKYNGIAESLISLGSGSASINNIQMAPAGVVSLIHPLAGNEGAIGHDLMRDPNRRDASIATIKRKGMVMVGPLKTIQGAKFIIGRLPVFIDRQLGGLDMRDTSMFPELLGQDHVPGKNFWGFTTVLFSWDVVVNQSRFKTIESQGYMFNLTQTNIDETGAKTDQVTLYLNSSGTITDGVRVGVEASGAMWDLDLEPIGGFHPNWPLPLCISAVVVCIAIAVLLFVALVASKENDELVRKMLPKQAARHVLRHPGKPYVQPFENAAIFFSDIVGYTSMAKDLSPIEVMELLNEVYTQFDIIAKQNGVYKVETIGDSYMVICGAPTACTMNEAVAKVARFGLDVVDCMSRFQTAKGLTMEVRCGMSSGPVVAGIVGTSMPRYCIFGDTVNMSSRMESTGAPGKFQTDSKTAKIMFNMKDQGGFKLAAREKTGIAVKGKGRHKTFWIQEYLGDDKKTVIVDAQGKGRQGGVEQSATLESANYDLWRTPSEDSRLAKESAQGNIGSQESPPQNPLGRHTDIERIEPRDTVHMTADGSNVFVNFPAGFETGHT